MAGPIEERRSDDGLDRRRLLKRMALGAGIAGVAWTTPALTSTVSAGPGSCVCTPAGVNLLAAPFGNNAVLTSGGPRAANGSNLTFARSSSNTITNTTCSPTTWQTARITNCQVGAITTGQIPLVRVGNATPQGVSLTINFSPAVSQLSFTVTDIDSTTNALVRYWEQVVISWVNASGSATPSYSPGSNLVQSAVPATDAFQTINNNFNSNFNDPSCNLGVQFDCGGTISSVTITSNDLNTNLGTSGTEGRMIGVAQLAFCTPSP